MINCVVLKVGIMRDELSPEKLRRECDPSLMKCESTEELLPLEGIIGQDRAIRALRFGLDIKESGFNIYVSGYAGTGRTTAVKEFLEELARMKPVPNDWCYVNNFKNSYEPKAIRLPAGKGKGFQKDMVDLIGEVRKELPKAFESEDYTAKREVTIKAIEVEREKLFAELNKRAQEEGFILQSSPIGLLTIPIVKGKPLNEKEFLSLSPEKRAEIQSRKDELTADLRNAMRQFKGLERKIRDALKNLNREVALYSVGYSVNELKEKYQEFPEVVAYLDEVQDDILENLDQFIGEPKTSQKLTFPWMKEVPFRKYEVDVIVDNSRLKGAPVVLELNPTYQNLFGRIEKEARFGVLTTDFTMIHGGSLHRSNGGYLVLPAEELLRNIFSWDGLKRALTNGQITIEEAGERLGFITTKGLKPEPVPLDVKVVLIGNPLLYQLLYMYDLEFKELFKVKADFDTVMDRTEENMQKYASFICTFCRKEKLKHLDASAVAKIVAYGSRLANDQEKLSTRFADIADVLREANFYATQEDSSLVTSSHVRKAIEEKIYRSNLIQQKIQEMIERGVLLIDTEGEAIGQVNGLSVLSMGDFSFGRPSRVTASIGIGREGVIDIEREARLGGPIHTKGVMILSGYLSEKYARDKPLSLSGRLVFEQSYSGVEGDSASSTELYAILSALSGLPIKQNIAVTGSVNQKGEVQAIGGVNEKIEGFFEVCKAKGLTGQQGVLVPESNVQNLMLKEEVVEAVKAGKFHIYSVRTVDEGIEILIGVKAGERLSDGAFEKDTVNYKVDERLKEMAERLKEFPTFVVEKKR
ncbi:MAG: AAA family ATPase [Candidatus Bathyarchaeota archaeon]|nr:AAA family ATPase [Candidatus Bathyarchaeota archaeon]